jgi:hypothetical protein
MSELIIEIVEDSKKKKNKKSASASKADDGIFSKFAKSDKVDAILDAVSLAAGAVTIAGSGVAGGAAATGVGIPASLAAFGITSVPAAVSFIADAVNAVRSLARGDVKRAALYIIFMVPIAGDALQLLKKTGMGDDVVKAVIGWAKIKKNVEKSKRISKAAIALSDAICEKVPGLEQHKDSLRDSIKDMLQPAPDAGGDPLTEHRLVDLYSWNQS